MYSYSLSVIIPAYNEQENIQAGRLSEVADWLKTYPCPAELIVVDDGSEDATLKLARAVTDRVISIPHSGKAAAVMTGMAAAVYEIILFTDMDQATPFTEAGKILPILAEPADIVIGSRGLLRQDAPLSRYILSLGHIILRYLLLGLSLKDTQCGFKACRTQVAHEILKHLKVYHPRTRRPIRGARVNSGFDTEFLLAGLYLGFKIVEIPVQWNYRRTRRAALFKEVWGSLVDLIAIAWQNLKGIYKRDREQSINGKFPP
jgi:glycosyltransferase involved in cell wall biosynthesis